MLNRVIIAGRLTKNPELHRFESGTAVTSFTLAVERDFKAKDGEKETDFIECSAWRNTAEFVSRYFSKGRMAIVEGKLQMRSWTDKDGNKRNKAEVVADNIYFGDSKPNEATSNAPNHSFDEMAERAETLFNSAGGGFAEVEDDDELPF